MNAPHRRLQTGLCLALAAVTVAVYWPVSHCDFVNYDDAEFVKDNPQVQQGLTWEGVGWAFRAGHGDYWHPLTWLSLMLDVTLFGRSAAGPHIVNLLLHAANAVLLLLLLRRLTGAVWPSAFVAALFALHPLHVESVAWVTERKDVLSLFFGLLTLHAYVGFALGPKVPGPKPKVYYALALICFALGLMSKAILVTLPFIMLLLDYWPLGRLAVADWRRAVWPLLREKIPFFACSAGICFATYLTANVSLAAERSLPFVVRVETAFVAYAWYLLKTFWPVNLAVLYPHPGQWSLEYVVLSAMVVAALSLWAILNRRKRPPAFVGWCWFLGTLLPVIGLVQIGSQFAADRFTYLPLIGLFIALSWSAGEVVTKWPALVRRGWLIGVAATLVLALCAARTRDQLKYWRDGESLFRRAVAVTRNNYLAQNNLGMALLNQGRFDEGAEHFVAALRINPRDVRARNNLGHALVSLGNLDEAIAQFRAALQIGPDNPETLSNLGGALSLHGQHDEAIACCVAAVRIQPDFRPGRLTLANALADAGRSEEAIEHYRLALKSDPTDVAVHNGLGVTLAMTGRSAEAVEHFHAALQSNPNQAVTHDNLGSALGMQDRLEEAIAHFKESLRLDPSRLRTRMNYGSALATQQKYGEAVEQFTEVVRLAPDFAPGHKNLGTALLALGRTNEAAAQFQEALRLDPGLTQVRQQLEVLSAQPEK